MARQRLRFALPTLRVAFYCLLLLTLLAAPAGRTLAAVEAPTLTGISVTEAPNDFDTTVIITGSNFSNPVTVKLGAVQLTSAQWLSATQIRATIRWGLTPGVYALTVSVGADGASATLPGAFTVTPGLNALHSEGPYGGGVLDIKVYVNPTTQEKVLFGDMGPAGLFRATLPAAGPYTDQNVTWERIFKSADYFSSLAMDTSTPPRLYISQQQVGLFRSDDLGNTWVPIPVPLEAGKVAPANARVFVHPGNPGLIFAGLFFEGAGCNSDAQCGFFKSADYGATWTKITASTLADQRVTSMAFHPTEPGTYYVNTASATIFETKDNGATWTDLGGVFEFQHPIELLVNPFNTNQLIAYGLSRMQHMHPGDTENHEHYLATRDVSSSTSNWEFPHLFPASDNGNQICKIMLDTRPEPDRLMAVTAGGIYTSTTSTDFTKLSEEMAGPCNSIGLDPTNASTFFTSYRQRGMFVTTDDGQSYTNTSRGLTGFYISDLRISPQDPATVYSMSQDVALFKTTNGGAKWHELPVDVGAGAISPLVLDPVSEGRIYLGSYFKYFTGANGGERQEDWAITSVEKKDAPAGLTGPAEFSNCWMRSADSMALAKGIAPGGKDRLFMGVSYLGSSDCTTPGMAVYASDDQGATWSLVYKTTSTVYPYNMVVDPNDPKRIYVGTSQENYNVDGVHYSLDGGVTWADAGMQIGRENTLRLPFITVGKNHTLLTGAGSYLAASSDHGKTWMPVADTGAGISKIVYDPDVPGLYVGTFAGVRVSYNDGRTWETIPGSLGQVPITALAVRQVDDRTFLYASTPGGDLSGAASSQTLSLRVADELLAGGVYRFTVVQTHSIYLPSVMKK